MNEEDIESQINAYKDSKVFKDKLSSIDWDMEDRFELISVIEKKVGSGLMSLDYISMVHLCFKKLR